MTFSPEIPETIEEVLDHPDFQSARGVLIQHIHSIPGSALVELTDSLHELLYRETGPDHVFPELDDCKCTAQSDDINIALRAPLSLEKGIIVPSPETGTEILETRIGVERSRESLRKLSLPQHVAVVRYAFAVRYDQLHQYLVSADIDTTSELSNHISHLRDMFEQILETLTKR